VTKGSSAESLQWVVLGLCILLFPEYSRAAGVDSSLTIGQFAHTSWGPKEGAPSLIRALAQTADGYLWLASPDGLYRFDGVVFERYQPASGTRFPSPDVASLLAVPNGDLWVGFRVGAISLLRDGNVTNYTVRDGLPNARIWGLALDREGTVWAATEGGLVRLDGSQWKRVGRAWNFPEEAAFAVSIDRQGTLWVAVQDTVMFLRPGSKRFEPTGFHVQANDGQIRQFAQAPNGRMWVGELGCVRPVPSADKRLPPSDAKIRVSSLALLFDHEGELWIASSGGGLYRSVDSESLRRGSSWIARVEAADNSRGDESSTIQVPRPSRAVDSFTTNDGLSGNEVYSILQDREGNVWSGTLNGLDRFSKTSLTPFFLPFKTIYPVLAPGDAGKVWLNLAPIESIHTRVVDYLHPIHSCRALSAYRGPDNSIWWFCDESIERYKEGKYQKLAFPSSLPKPYWNVSVTETTDGRGGVWLAVEGGLFDWRDGSWRQLETEFARLQPRAAFTDSTGRAWIGYEGGTLLVLNHGRIEKVFRGLDSPVGEVKAITGRGSHIWVGGERGLAFFDGVRLRPVIPADSETFDSVLGIEETSDGSLWLVENETIVRIPAQEVEHVLDNPSYRVRYRVFDSSDGVPGTFAGTAILRKQIQGTDGRLWFGATGGIVWIDPAHIFTNPLPPPVVIRSVSANGWQFGMLADLVLPPRTTNLRIDYTALSLTAPEKVRFRYMLEGVDKGWQDAGPRREAFYTRLGPGQYHFRVIACNNDGVWNDQGVRLEFRIAPAWFQTSWFDALCACAFLLLLWTLYQLRLRQLRRQFHAVVETRVDERTRIARELHDTLLQSFQGLTLNFQRARNLLPGRASEAVQVLDAALDGAEQAIVEGRDAIHDLRFPMGAPYALEEEIKALGEELAAKGEGKEGQVEFRLVIEGSARELRLNVYTEVFRITREALRNAFRHSRAHLIEAEMAYTAGLLRLRVRDDGKGIDPDERDRSERNGHWGLRGMQERAEHLGGELEVWSEPGAGTEIELSVPGSIAYKTVTTLQSSFWRFRRRRGDQG